MKDRQVAILLNSPYLGGAERSIIAQAKMMKGKLTLFVPQLTTDYSSEIENYASDMTIVNYRYPLSLYGVSRGRGIGAIFKIFALALLLVKYRSLGLKKYDVLWCNGNKVGFPVLFNAIISRFQGKLVWHFRDYPALEKGWSLTWNLLRISRKFCLVLVGNSHSVTSSLQSISHDHLFALYNPVGIDLPNRSISKVKSIGIVSMMAPWKGLHQILLWASLYQRELQEMGIERIKIFGGDIYATKGKHQGYLEQLYQLGENFPSSLIEFCGKCSPFQIYQEIDLLIHPVIAPEPFGRIISEAYYSGIAVLSTQLGGSSELVVGKPIYQYDYAGMTERVRELATNRLQYSELVYQGRNRLLEIEAGIEKEIEAILNCS